MRIHVKAFCIILCLCCIAVGAIAQEEEDDAIMITAEDPEMVLTEEDLAFSGLSFLTSDPEACMEVYRSVISDQTQTMPAYTLREIVCEGVLLEFIQAEDGTWQWETLLVTGEDTPDGPRGLQLDLTVEDVQALFGLSADDEDTIYYGEDTHGNEYALRCSFTEGILTEYLLYRI